MRSLRSALEPTAVAWRSGALGVWAWVLVFGAYMAFFHINSDAFWMARSGAEALGSGQLIRMDRWSWDPVPGSYWPVSPGWELLLGSAFTLGGPSTVQYVVGLAMAVSVGALVLATKRLGGSSGVALVTLGFFELVAPGTLEARAAFLALAWFVYSIVALSSPHRVTRLPSPLHVFLASFLVSTIGVWIHASWCLLAAAIPIAVMLREDFRERSVLRRCAAVGASAAGAILGVLTTPVRSEIWALSVQLREICKDLIGEWKSPLELSLGWQVSAAVLTMLLILLAFSHIRQRPLLQPAFNAKMVLLLSSLTSIFAGWLSVRFLWQAAVMATPPLAATVSAWLREARPTQMPTFLANRLNRVYLTPVMNLTALLLGLIIIGISAFNPLYPRPQLMARLPVGCNLLSGFHTSNLALVLRPDVRPWFDGRMQYWGRDRIVSGFLYLTGQMPGEITPVGTTCVISTLESGGSLDRRLASTKDWYVAASEDGVNLWLRKS